MIPTTEDALDDTVRVTIAALTPRIVYKGSETWKPYERSNDSPSASRRFRLLWEPIGIYAKGIQATKVYEYESELIVRTDYAGVTDKVKRIAADDYAHLLEAILDLKNRTPASVLFVEGSGVSYDFGDEDSDVVRVDHRYKVRFLRSRL